MTPPLPTPPRLPTRQPTGCDTPLRRSDMNEHPYEDTAAEPEPDPRIVAMHRVVDLERQHEQKTHDAERRAKEAAIVREELRVARDELCGLLGYPSNSGGEKYLDAQSGELRTIRTPR